MEQNNTPKKGRKKLIFPIILALVLVGALIFSAKEYFYYQSHEETDNAQIDADISPVVARVGGYVKEIRFQDNQFVHAGDTLVILDDRDYQVRLQQAQAALSATRQNVDVSETQVSEAQTGIATAQANVEAAKVRVWKANEDFTRYQNLYNDHAITRAQFDDAKAEKDAAEAALNVAQTQVPVQARKVNTNRSQVGAAASNIASRHRLCKAAIVLYGHYGSGQWCSIQKEYPAGSVGSGRSVAICHRQRQRHLRHRQL